MQHAECSVNIDACERVQMRTTTECGYLDGGGADGLGALRFAALYGSWDAARARAMFALHLPMDARRALIPHLD